MAITLAELREWLEEHELNEDRPTSLQVAIYEDGRKLVILDEDGIDTGQTIVVGGIPDDE